MFFLKKTITYLVIPIITTELLLRLFIVEPGIFRNYNGFEKVDNLIIYRNYEVDEYGIYKLSKLVIDSVQDLNITIVDKFFNNKDIFKKVSIFNDKLADIISDFDNVKKSELANYYQKIIKKQHLKPEDSLIINYIDRPFNEEGFRSITFKNIDTKKKKILLLGDSFTYGASASPIHNSFADYLLSKGFLIYNTGISGVDPAQYYAITKKYLPVLDPDIVILNFCIGNDMMLFDRKPNKNEPLEHITNAGYIYSNPEGKYLNTQEAYNYYLKFIKIPDSENIIFRKTAIGTKAWSILFNQNKVRIPEFEQYLEAQKKTENNKIEVTKKYLTQIIELCNDKNIPLIISLIPDINSHNHNESKFVVIKDSSVIELFKDLKYYYPENFEEDDFVGNGDFHFNNKGSLKYGQYLESLLNETLKPPSKPPLQL